jgi:hypothetical protein
MTIRFNKDNVLIHIEKRMALLQERWGFDSNNGWSQVQGADIEKIVAYGEFNGLDELHTELFNSDLRG